MPAKSLEWPAFSVERRDILGLKPYAGNARTHSDAQVSQVAASIREWGWTQPVLIDEKGGVLAGHCRLLAARSLGVPEVPVIVARGWSSAQKRAYILADNQLTLNAGWDEDLLRVEIGALGEMGFDIDLLGFGTDFLAGLMADRTAGLTDPDEAPEAPVNPVTRLGDLWVCGRHRVLCGDATKAEDVGRVLAAVAPSLMVTDPPYGVDYDANWRNETGIAEVGSLQRGKTGRVRRIIGAKAIGKVVNDDRTDWRSAWANFPGDVAYVWHADRRASEVETSLAAEGFAIRCQIVWDKGRMIIGRGDYHWAHEPCWYAVRKGKVGHWSGDRTQQTMWRIEHRASETGHSTQKPVECMRRPIMNNSSPGQAVYDPFLGSGTTMIAAEMEGRACLGLEISPAYCDVMVQRWQNFTGEAATLDDDGRTFEDIDAERYDPARNSAGCYDVAIKEKRKRLQAAE